MDTNAARPTRWPVLVLVTALALAASLLLGPGAWSTARADAGDSLTPQGDECDDDGLLRYGGPDADDECDDDGHHDKKEYELRIVEGDPDCVEGTVRVEKQVRWRKKDDHGDWGPWSQWHTIKSWHRDTTEEDCPPPPEPPCEGPCDLPEWSNSEGDVTCRGAIKDRVVDDVHVPAGARCVLVDSYVNGSVLARGARSVLVYDTPIRGDLRSIRTSGDTYVGSKDECAYDPFIGGSLVVRRSHNVLGCALQVCEAVRLVGNDGKVTLRASSMRDLLVTKHHRFVRDRGDASHRWLRRVRLIDVQVEGSKQVVQNRRPVVWR
jgi:hypothetical protein